MIFTGNANPDLGREVARILGVPLGRARIDRHPDGEPDIEIQEDLRGEDVFLIQPTQQPDRNLIELVLMISAAQSPARRVVAIVPYLWGSRQDRRDRPHVPVSVIFALRSIAEAGTGHVIFLDLHSAQIDSMFEAVAPKIGRDHVFFRAPFLDWLSKQDLTDVTVSSIDAGGAKVSESTFVRLIQMGHPVELGIGAKSGSSTEGISHIQLMGKYNGQRVIFKDDMVSTGKSADEAAREALRLGAKDVWLFITHPIFSRLDDDEDACRRLADSPISRVITTDSIPISDEHRAMLGEKLTVVSIAPLLAMIIKHLHEERSISMFFELAGYREGLEELGLA